MFIHYNEDGSYIGYTTVDDIQFDSFGFIEVPEFVFDETVNYSVSNGELVITPKTQEELEAMWPEKPILDY